MLLMFERGLLECDIRRFRGSHITDAFDAGFLKLLNAVVQPDPNMFPAVNNRRMDSFAGGQKVPCL